ncbi:MAG: DNA-directed RNA polymerase subunit beta [Desulfoplanes sp.]|nr:DNA-directed RNA polymerase subunit beta [Desulfoplanes sp.]
MNQFVKKFGTIKDTIKIPHLLTLQIDSFKKFLQTDVPPSSREDIGLEGVFRSVFPIQDFNKTATLEYVSYEIGEPKYNVEECISKGLSYEAPVRIKVRLVVFDIDEETQNRTIHDIKEQDIYFGTIPLMTTKGTFVVNGTERVIVNQLQRSPGIIFEHDSGKTHSSRKVLYSSRIIPMRGSWLDFDFDHKDFLYVRIDRRRKMPVTILLKAMGMSTREIFEYFYDFHRVKFEEGHIYREVQPQFYRKDVAVTTLSTPEGKQLIAAGGMITRGVWKHIIAAGIDFIEVNPAELSPEYIADEIIHPETGEVVAGAGDELNQELMEKLAALGIHEVKCLFTNGLDVSTSLRDTLRLDKTTDTASAQVDIYKRLRPSSPPTPEVSSTFFDNLFRNHDYYDLSAVGRYKLNTRLGLDLPLDMRTLSNEDILTALKHLIYLKDTNGPADDIDHLGNRRVRPVGELVENQYRIGLVRMERAIKERMSLQEVATLMPHDLVNPKPVTAVLKEFFGTSQLSQFMDQTNALSEVTHKRRLSALGPGGLTRERAGFEVRDVHPSHYGRICPIETPEGPNIGLIVSLTTQGIVNDFGFIETPYRIVKDGKVTDEVKYYDASREKGEIIAQANARLADDGSFLDDQVSARVEGEFAIVDKRDVTLRDISPSQIVSVSASLIPFLEHDDANRALMGCNMQRQAVPLLRSEKPLVGTGMEGPVARDSGACLLAEGDGVVQFVDAERVIVRYETLYPETGGTCFYLLQKFHKSNQNSCFGQKPRVLPDQHVVRGDILADGAGIEDGELALGKNLLVAFMPWCGYNYEDSVLISEKTVKDDVYTSIHIEEFDLIARDTKLGPEEVTRDIPNVGEDMLRNLDDSGIIRIGARVGQDDILVGKITPKGETQLTPEERLLRAIFGEKARDVKNTSLKVPPGVEGIVLDVKVFNRRSGDKDMRTKEIEDDELHRIDRRETQHIFSLTTATSLSLWKVVEGKMLVRSLMGKRKGEILAETNQTLTLDIIQQVPLKKLAKLFKNKEVNDTVQDILDLYERQKDAIHKIYELKREKVCEGDDLPPGVINMVKVYIAVKRKLRVGDKMAGRHGNKGVVSNILPEEDMPFFASGQPVDIVLNPLGVPSRMNIGQIMETHLGWASKELGMKIADMIDRKEGLDQVRKEIKDIYASPEINELMDELSDDDFVDVAKELRRGIVMKTPVFDGAHEDEIWNFLKRVGLPDDGKSVLYDGRTGDPFDHKVTVGYMYYLKLHHLVDEKIHARSTGPYSLVTQQPLGGKAQFGGQRLGEMEVWAIEAYGAAHLLQEFLTVKSDDVSGRVKMYEKIVKGNNSLESGMPESFNVLVKEMMSLCLDVTLVERSPASGKRR